IYGYSVFGYELLARVVEVISGLRIEDYVHRKILEPLGMSNTVYRLEGKHHLLIAKEYKDEDVMPHLLPRDTPVNGLYSTSHDLTRLVSMLMAGGVYENRRILSKNAVKEMFTPQNKSVLLDLDREVGFAWNLSGSGLKNVDGIATLTGSALFSASRIGLSLEHQTAVIVLSNSAGSWGAIEKISKEALARVIELKSGTRPEIIEAEKEVPITIAGAEKREFKSDYATFLGWGQITPQGKDLEAELMGWTLRLSPHDSGWYSVHYDLLGVISLDADWITKVRIAPAAIAGRNILLSWHNGQRYYFGLEWKKAAIPEQWTSRVGKYELSNPDIMTDRLNVQEGELQIDGGRVYFYYTIPNMIGSYLSVPITPMDANTAIIPGLGTFMNETISVVNTDKGEALEFSGYLWKKKTKRLDDWF
ncbi:MAG: serine hydrolase, partial [Gammaproteobacteria bacterium]|nr:serine hydrolase [Gammaproteobacteria bacterium]